MGHLQCVARTSTLGCQKNQLSDGAWNAPQKTDQTDRQYQENNMQLQMRKRGRRLSTARRFSDGNSYFFACGDVESQVMCLTGIIQQLKPAPGNHSQAWAENIILGSIPIKQLDIFKS